MSRTRAAATLVACLLLVVAGCAGAPGADGDWVAGTDSTTDDTPGGDSDAAETGTDGPNDGGDAGDTDGESTTDERPADRLGVEGGVRATDDLAVTPADGLNETELAAVVNRTMARVELIRQLEFRESVPVEVISREEYRERNVFSREVPPRVELFRSQVWEAQFVVGEDESVAAKFDALYGGAVAGYYSPGSDQIVIVSDSETPRLDRTTLAHELVHALQDQHFEYRRTDTRDGRLAAQGLTEGDARYVDTLYDERCREEWDCVPKPESGGGSGGQIDPALFVAIYQPYADGSGFVHALRQRGGWAAVNDAYENYPVSTEQTIHPDAYPDEGVREVTVPDRSNRRWNRIDARGRGERLGELGVYTTLWAGQAIDRERYYQSDGDYSSRTYAVGASEGWAGDRLVPYRNGDETGYVWRLAWDSRRDARQFVDAYERLVRLRLGGREVREGVFRVADGGFADAFRVERRGKTVVIVNAPTVADLDRVHEAR